MKTKVVVCGATGSQGSSVVDAFLLEKAINNQKYEIVAVTRNPETLREKYKNVSSLVHIVQADWLDFVSLCRAFQGAHAVFGVTQPWNKEFTHADVQAEVQQGQNILEACIHSEVSHLIFSSAANLGENDATGIPHVDSKLEIEAMIQEKASSSGNKLQYTILQPVQFIDNLGLPFFPVTHKGWIQGFVHKDSKVPWVAVRDIGKIAKIVADNPNEFSGKKLVLVGDFVSGVQVAQSMTKIRRDMTFQYWAPPAWIIRLLSLEFYKMRKGFEGIAANPVTVERVRNCIAECRRIHPQMLSAEAYLKFAKWDTRELAPPSKEATTATSNTPFWLLLAFSAATAGAAMFGKTSTQKATWGTATAVFVVAALSTRPKETK